MEITTTLKLIRRHGLEVYVATATDRDGRFVAETMAFSETAAWIQIKTKVNKLTRH